jgi:hypothetical protein
MKNSTPQRSAANCLSPCFIISPSFENVALVVCSLATIGSCGLAVVCATMHQMLAMKKDATAQECEVGALFNALQTACIQILQSITPQLALK